jgi:hypothetical protein
MILDIGLAVTLQDTAWLAGEWQRRIARLKPCATNEPVRHG